MGNLLKVICFDKRRWLEQQKRRSPLATFQRDVSRFSQRKYYDTLYQRRRHGAMAFTLEYKIASPSQKLLFNPPGPAEVAEAYAPYASVLSVVTDRQYFHGDLSFLSMVRKSVSVPILCKDFFLDPYQVYHARYNGADAILLMLSVLDDEQYNHLSHLAHSLGMGVLTEVATEEEALRATKLKARVVGINNRNLCDLSIDLNRTRRLRQYLPPETFVVSESGIKAFEDTVLLRPYCDGFLVGSSLMRTGNIGMASRALVFGKNKICGLRKPEDAVWAQESGALFGGLIFVNHSKRCLPMRQARRIVQAAPLKYVGIFQNSSVDCVIATIEALGLHAVQLHGLEDATYIRKIRERAPTIVVFKTVPIDWRATVFPDYTNEADFYVLDTTIKGMCGGTGRRFPWHIVPDEIKKRALLSGGIGGSVEGVQQAAKQGCMGLDMNSQLEDERGYKSREKICMAFKALRKKWHAPLLEKGTVP